MDLRTDHAVDFSALAASLSHDGSLVKDDGPDGFSCDNPGLNRVPDWSCSSGWGMSEECTLSILHAWILADANSFVAAEALFIKVLDSDPRPCSRLLYSGFLQEFVSPEAALEQVKVALEMTLQVRSETPQQEIVRQGWLSLIWNRMAELYREMGSLELARRVQQRAVSADLNCCLDTGLRRRTLLGQGQDFAQCAESSSAKFLFQSLCGGHDDIAIQARIELAAMSVAEEEFSAAQHQLRDSVSACEESRLGRLQLRALTLLSQTMIAQRDYQAGLEAVEKGLAIAQSSPRFHREHQRLRKAQQQLLRTMRVVCQTSEWN